MAFDGVRIDDVERVLAHRYGVRGGNGWGSPVDRFLSPHWRLGLHPRYAFPDGLDVLVRLRGGAVLEGPVRAVHVAYARHDGLDVDFRPYLCPAPETFALAGEAADEVRGQLPSDVEISFVRYASLLRRPAVLHRLLRFAPGRVVVGGRARSLDELPAVLGVAHLAGEKLAAHPAYGRISAAYRERSFVRMLTRGPA